MPASFAGSRFFVLIWDAAPIELLVGVQQPIRAARGRGLADFQSLDKCAGLPILPVDNISGGCKNAVEAFSARIREEELSIKSPTYIIASNSSSAHTVE